MLNYQRVNVYNCGTTATAHKNGDTEWYSQSELEEVAGKKEKQWRLYIAAKKGEHQNEQMHSLEKKQLYPYS